MSPVVGFARRRLALGLLAAWVVQGTKDWRIRRARVV